MAYKCLLNEPRPGYVSSKDLRCLFSFFFIIALFISPGFLYAGDFELPSHSKSDQIITHKAYTVCYDPGYHLPKWTVYKLTPEMLIDVCKRKDEFREDPFVKTGTATKADYKNTGYDKGHMVPADDMGFSVECMSETFFMSNMCPQMHSFNAGVWKRLEEQVRKWAQKNEEIYVVSGPILKDKGLRTLGKSKVSVPIRFYKVVLDNKEPEVKAIAFILPHKKINGDLSAYAVTVDKAEEITGLDFFPELPDSIENKIESKIELDKWFHKKADTTNVPN